MRWKNLWGTALRNVVGELELDQTLSERDSINAKMQNYMDEVTGKWGVKVNRVELKNIVAAEGNSKCHGTANEG